MSDGRAVPYDALMNWDRAADRAPAAGHHLAGRLEQ